MRTGTVSYKLEDLRKGVIIPIGMVGENDFTRVIFDAEEVFKKHPDAQVTMKVQPPKGGIYPATVTRDGNAVIWQVKAADVAHRGSGELQLTFTADTMVEKSYIAKTDIKRSLVGNGPAPDPVQDWVDNAEEVLDDLAAMDNIAKTAEAGDVGKALSPKTVENGVVTEWQYVEPGAGTEDYTDLENKPQIGGVELSGDKSLHDLGIAAESAIPDVSGKANLSVVAPAFDQATANDAGSLVTYTDGVVYVLPEGHTAGTTWANTQKNATNIAEQQRLLLNDIEGFADTDANLKQLEDNGYQKYFPEWESGEWNNNGKGTNNDTQRSKSLIYLPSGTYTVYSKIQMSVFCYPTTGATDGNAIQWKLTGEQTITITTRHYVGFMVEMASDDGVPTGNYAVIPSAVSDAIANATKALNTANEAISKTEYSDGIFHTITTGTTLYENKGIGSGILVGAVVNMTNDNYAKVLEVPVSAGKKYRMKARVYNNYYLVHFTDANNILIEKTGKNTTGSTTTMVDVVATAPAGATKAYLSGMKNTMILCEVLEPYTVKQIVDMEHKPTRGSFCIMEFNVGDWYEGRYRDADHTGIIPADETIYENYMSLFNGIFGRYKPDIAMLNEDARYMCLNTHDDDRAFVGQYFRHQYSGLFQSQDKTDVFNTLACAFPMFDLSVRNFTDTESNMHRNYVKGYTYLNGKKVCIISAHLSSDLATAKLNATELLNDLQTEDPEYMICCGDFNYDTNVAEIAAFETAGYTISRGNVVHGGHTYGPGDLIVTTSNITVKSVFCDTQKIDASFVEYIDHLPTIAYLEIY